MPTSTDTKAALHFIDEDPCCAKRLAKALLKMAESQDRWTCPKCGCDWQSRKREDGMITWHAVVIIQVWR